MKHRYYKEKLIAVDHSLGSRVSGKSWKQSLCGGPAFIFKEATTNIRAWKSYCGRLLAFKIDI